MGVTGLWKLIDSAGKPVPLESLENKVLAIDISIWLHQVIKGYQDNKGSSLAYAHILGLFHRLCKLLYYRIKPVFVFDGGAPSLKLETIAKRNQGRNKLLREAERVQHLLLSTLVKEHVVQKALGAKAIDILKSPPKGLQGKKSTEDEMFKLPELPSNVDIANTSTASSSCCSTDSESSTDDRSLRHMYHNSLQSIDVTSANFRSLPADIRHEILTDIKETRKQSSWGKLHELPTVSDDFSSFQMKRLLKRRQVQVSLEEAEQQMGGKCPTLNELRTLLTEGGVVTESSTEFTRPIASDENTRYLLVRDIKRAVEKAETEEEEKLREQQEKLTRTNFDDEFDADLQHAIKLSMESNSVYKDEDYDVNKAKMNRVQRKNLRNAALSLARSYMIEYGGMNDDDVNELFECTQIQNSEDPYSVFSLKDDDSNHSDQSEEVTQSKPKSQSHLETGNCSKQTKSDQYLKESDEEIGIISSNESDSDFEIVEESGDTKTEIKNKDKMEIFIDLTKNIESEDIFADIFQKQVPPSRSLSESGSVFSQELRVSESSEEDEMKLKNREQLIENKNGNNINHVNPNNKESSLEILEKTSKEKLNVTEVEGKIEKDEEVADKEKESNTPTLERSKDKKALTLLSCIQNIIKERDPKKEMKIGSTDHNSSEAVNNVVAKETIESFTTNMANILVKLKKDLNNIPSTTFDDLVIGEDSKPDQIAILEDLKIELAEIKNLTLENIKKGKIEPNEIIEILDDNSPKSTEPGERIDNYFDVQYTIKRTPEKKVSKEETPPKVSSPFFVNKSPVSSERKERKRNILLEDDEEIPKKRSTTVSKTLFNNEVPSSNSQDILAGTAQTLKEKTTPEELQSLAQHLATKKKNLEFECNRQSRMGTSVTEKMTTDCMYLLELFGIPYVFAPMEAEAQCAFLDSVGMTDGTITDDSDIWLFGGTTVYKNFFNQKKHVMEFKIENIENSYRIDRNKLIQLAILVGSDYTSGVNGIGTVTALEILATFPLTPAKEGETSQEMSILSSLRKFKDWFRNGKSIGVAGKTALKSKLKNVELTEGFPNSAIVDAYLYPKVDNSLENFTWGKVDLETMREYTKKTFGWTRSKTDHILLPVLKKMQEKKVQKSIKNFFEIKKTMALHDIKVSKRVKKAIDKMSRPGCSTEDESAMEKAKQPATKDINTDNTNAGDFVANCQNAKEVKKIGKRKCHETASSSTAVSIPKSLSAKLAKRIPSIPETNPVIPQKVKEAEEMEKRKAKAAEVLQNSKGTKYIVK